MPVFLQQGIAYILNGSIMFSEILRKVVRHSQRCCSYTLVNLNLKHCNTLFYVLKDWINFMLLNVLLVFSCAKCERLILLSLCAWNSHSSSQAWINCVRDEVEYFFWSLVWHPYDWNSQSLWKWFSSCGTGISTFAPCFCCVWLCLGNLSEIDEFFTVLCTKLYFCLLSRGIII